MTPITSLQNPTIKLIRSLSERKERRERGLFVAEGLAMLERALALDWKPDFLLATKPPMLWDDVKPLIVSDKVMAELSAQNNPHEVLAVFRTRYERGVEPSGTWLALEDIRDPGNLGTILRTAEAAGASGILLAGECCDPYSPESVRASTGSIFASRLAHMPAVKLVDLIKGWPGDSVGTAMAARQDFRTPYRQPALVVMGSEARGLSPAVSAACSKLVHIPMAKGVESLNVATATALMLYEVRRGEL